MGQLGADLEQLLEFGAGGRVGGAAEQALTAFQDAGQRGPALPEQGVRLRGGGIADVAWDLAFVLAIAVVIAAAAAAVFAALETSARRTGMLSRF